MVYTMHIYNVLYGGCLYEVEFSVLNFVINEGQILAMFAQFSNSKGHMVCIIVHIVCMYVPRSKLSFGLCVIEKAMAGLGSYGQ